MCVCAYTCVEEQTHTDRIVIDSLQAKEWLQVSPVDYKTPLSTVWFASCKSRLVGRDKLGDGKSE